MELEPIDIENLRHMLGAGSHIPKNQHGYRNYFCSTTLENDDDYQSMVRMERLKYVTKGGLINNGQAQIFHATLLGCKAIRLTREETQRALGVQ